MKKNNYYNNKIDILEKIFNTKLISLDENKIIINNKEYPIVEDVIVLNETTSDIVKNKTVKSFGNEWTEFNEITHEHYEEFKMYFDILDLKKFENANVIDLGCGIGRWSKILADKVNLKSIVLLDFSESIYVARNFFKEYDNAIFIKSDLENLNFKSNSFELLICLGVLHHLPKREIKILNKISKLSDNALFYLYYKLDETSFLYQTMFLIADKIRLLLSKSTFYSLNIFISYFLTIFFYYPFVILVKILKLFRINADSLPLSFYTDSSFFRIRQDAYDRFFTNIEYRTSKKEIHEIYGKYYSNIKISNKKPYWHFLASNKN